MRDWAAEVTTFLEQRHKCGDVFDENFSSIIDNEIPSSVIPNDKKPDIVYVLRKVKRAGASPWLVFKGVLNLRNEKANKDNLKSIKTFIKHRRSFERIRSAIQGSLYFFPEQNDDLVNSSKRAEVEKALQVVTNTFETANDEYEIKRTKYKPVSKKPIELKCILRCWHALEATTLGKEKKYVLIADVINAFNGDERRNASNVGQQIHNSSNDRGEVPIP